MQRSVSQNFDLRHSFHFMKCRVGLHLITGTGARFFLYKIKTRAAMENLRHASLEKNLRAHTENFRSITYIQNNGCIK